MCVCMHDGERERKRNREGGRAREHITHTFKITMNNDLGNWVQENRDQIRRLTAQKTRNIDTYTKHRYDYNDVIGTDSS